MSSAVSQAKSELGLFSEDGVEETRDLFWRKVLMAFGSGYERFTVLTEPFTPLACRPPIRAATHIYAVTRYAFL